MTVYTHDLSPSLMGPPRASAAPAAASAVAARRLRVISLFTVLWVLSAADLGFTLWAHRFTPFVEGNPLAAGMLPCSYVGGTYAGVILLKLATVAIGSVIFWTLRRHREAEIGLAGLVLILVFLMGLWSQYTVLTLREPTWIGLMAQHRDAQRGPSPIFQLHTASLQD